MKKLVSVIIPAYNVEKYLTQTLDSVIEQTYLSTEIIIVNDGSVDKTGEIIQRYAKKDSRIIAIFEKNKGLSGARNTGLRQAKGEYICIFDADDIMLPDKIEKQVSFLENHPGCDVVWSNVYHFINGTKKVYIWSLPKLSKDMYFDLLKFGGFINPNTTIFKREIYKKYGGFDENIRSCEDWEYWLKLSYHQACFIFMSEFLTLYRIRQGSLSSDLVTMSKTALYVLEKQKGLLQSTQNNLTIKNHWHKIQFKLLLAYLCKGDKKNAHEVATSSASFMIFYIAFLCLPRRIIIWNYKLLLKVLFFIRFQPVNNNNSIKKLLTLLNY